MQAQAAQPTMYPAQAQPAQTLQNTVNIPAPYGDFKLPSMADSEFSDEELAEDMAGVQLNFPTIKIPGGGSPMFVLPGGDPNRPKCVETLEGVILFSHPANAFWAKGRNDDDENVPPDCSSVDNITGIGSPGGACALCPNNKYGTAEKGKGKACKNMRHLYFLRDGESMPTLIPLAPTSLQPYNGFVSSVFAARRRGTCGSIIQIGLKILNNGKDDYSVATFKWLRDFSGEELLNIKQYAESFKYQIREMLTQRALEAMNRADTEIIDASYSELADNEFRAAAEQFAAPVVGAVIRGDLEELPM
ncbi:MAG: hypothetical protein LBN43_06910 [Oscillospiraceae bacterium]|jgi:hypothetical protein|nr:hypothetical protein [Oscillospiraceae bacterium]